MFFFRFFFSFESSECMYSEQDLVRYLLTKTNVISKRSEKTAVVGTWGRPIADPGPRVSPIACSGHSDNSRRAAEVTMYLRT